MGIDLWNLILFCNRNLNTFFTTSGRVFFRTISGLVYICECYEINGILTVITEC